MTVMYFKICQYKCGIILKSCLWNRGTMS